MRSPGNDRKPQIWPISLNKKSAKIKNSTDCDYKLISFEGGQDTSACKILSHSHYAWSGKCPETPNLTHFTQVKLTPKGGKINMYRWKEVISGFGRADGQPENILPPAPKGRGIKSTLVQVTALHEQTTRHYLKQCWSSSPTHKCGTRGRWINILRARQNYQHFADDIFKNIFLNKKVRIFIRIPLECLPKRPTNN